jgi:uncharacterized protein YwqG/predicted DNA-binding WGR domain protein
MKRRFEYKDEKSNKFWEIEQNGNAYTTWYGRIGGNPQSDTNEFDTEEKASKAYAKIIAEKTKKGYKEVGGAETSEVKPSAQTKTQEDSNKLKIPRELKKYAAEIEASKKQYVSISFVKAEAGCPVTRSKIGGNFYFPKGFEYPQDPSGKPLWLLAQINFAEVPKQMGYPEKGILQFYIGTDVLMGFGGDPITQNKFRIVYFEDADPKTHAEIKIQFDKEIYIPNEQSAEMVMQFEKDFDTVGYMDHRFSKLLPKLTGADDEDLIEKYAEEFDTSGHKLGGYPCFTQDDPRGDSKRFEDYELLFQLDTDGESDIMWGDGGVGNFFIAPKDLAAKDFSKVMYNWDCY